jgi:hypothetical protein
VESADLNCFIVLEEPRNTSVFSLRKEGKRHRQSTQEDKKLEDIKMNAERSDRRQINKPI